MKGSTAMLRIKALLILSILMVSIYSEPRAEETSYASYSPAVYAIAGLFIVDVGVSLSNGFSLMNDNPNKINGYFGVVTGVISLGLVAVNFAVEDNADLRNGFALTMGTAGTASLVLGILNVRRSRDTQEDAIEQSRIIMYPSLNKDGEQKYRVGFNVNITF